MGCARVRRGSRGDHGHPSHDPWPRRAAKGADRCDAEPDETVSVGGSVLLVPDDGYILEIRESTEL